MWMPTRMSPPPSVLDREGVVEILGVVGIDREDGDRPVVEAPLRVPLAHVVRDGRGLALDVGGKVRLEAVLDEDPEELGPGLVGAARAGSVISPTSGCSRRRHSPSFTTTLSPGWGTGLTCEREGSGTAIS